MGERELQLRQTISNTNRRFNELQSKYDEILNDNRRLTALTQQITSENEKLKAIVNQYVNNNNDK